MRKLPKSPLELVKLSSNIAKSKVYWFRRFNPKTIRRKKQMLQFYSQFIKEGDLCFDVGAAVGNRTEFFLKLGAKVICIEPQEVFLQHLNKSFGNNKNVIILPQGVADREGVAELYICQDNPYISTMSDKWREESRFSNDWCWEKTQEIFVTTLNTLISQYGVPAFCKIDVEGLEVAVIKGLSIPIPTISFEFTREFFDDAKECINHLLSIGEVAFNCSIAESFRLLSPTWVAPDELYQKLDLIEDKLLWGDVYAKFP